MMKNLICLTLMLMFACGTAQERTALEDLNERYASGSGFSITSIDENQLDNLFLLGKVWGFLKYHHPEIAKGTYNWDYELFQCLPNFYKVSKKRRDDLLEDWVSNLGEVEYCKSCRRHNENGLLHPDHGWINELGIGPSAALLSLLESDVPNYHHYLSINQNVGNPNFPNESAYEHMPYPDAGYRLLSLYRYWNIIEYYSPYRYLIEKDWDDVLKMYIPIFLAAEDELAYEKAVLRLIAEVGDSHGWILSGDDAYRNWTGTNVPPIHVRFIEDQLVITDYYQDDLKSTVGLPIGTIITKINGLDIAEIIEEKRPFYAASTEGAFYRDLAPDLLRSNAELLKLTVKNSDDDDREIDLPLYQKGRFKRYHAYPPYDGPTYKWLPDSIGYVSLQNIREDDVWQIRSEFEKARAIIIDIRNYPKESVAYSLGAFFTTGTTPFVKSTRGSVAVPGQFHWSRNITIYGTSNPFRGKLTVLVNEFSQSHAEFMAMVFRSGLNTTIIGGNTAGADGNVSKFSLPGGIDTWITGIGIYYPDGSETQRIGIVPDIAVRPTIKGIREGRDELMEAAIQFIMEE